MSLRVLVTGGAGFIGRNLIQRLLTDGHHVISMDSFYCGTHNEEFKSNERYRFIEHNVTNPFDVPCDLIYHLACPASPVHYQSDAVGTLKTAFIGTMNALENARKYGARILISSTSEVYGDPEVHPQPETYWGRVNCLGPRACYDEGKRAAESLAIEYHRQYKVNVAIARIFNTYGPYMSCQDGRVVSNFIVQALRDQDITIYGPGTQTRSFCFITDLIEGLIKMMQSDERGPINLGNPQEITINDLAKEIIKHTASCSAIVHEKLPQDDPLIRKPDISLAQSRLSWKPHVSLDQGLRETVDYFRDVLRSKPF